MYLNCIIYEEWVTQKETILSNSSKQTQMSGQYLQIEEKESHLYPRCEYKTRFYATSVFKMSEPAYR